MSRSLEDTGSVAGAAARSRRRWIALSVLLLASFMDLLDSTIVNVALPSIGTDIEAGYSALQWIVAGYTLTFALLLITGARLGDILGRKRAFLIGVAGFTIASALCGAAVNPGMLIGSRVLQGVAAAVMIPQVLAIAQVSFTDAERPKVLGIYGGMAGLATVSGPVLGALLIDADLFGWQWRSIFLVNVPVGIIALIAGWMLIDESRATKALRLDGLGVLLATLGLLMVVFPVVEGRDLGWPVWGFVSMVAAVPVLALFVLWERAKTRRDGSPLVVLSLFRRRPFVSGLLVNLLLLAVVGGFFLTFMLFLQIGLGFSVLHAGLTNIPFSIGVAMGSGTAVQLAVKVGRKVLTAGSVIMALGIGGLFWTIHHQGPAVTSWQMLPSLFVAGLGMGCLVAPIVDLTVSGVSHDEVGSASGLLNATQQLGAAVGVAAIGAVFFAALGSHADGSVDQVASQVRSGLASAGVSPADSERILGGFRTCFHDTNNAVNPAEQQASCIALDQSGVARDPKVGSVVAAAGARAGALNFVSSVQIGFSCLIGVLAVLFVLTFFLPPRQTEDVSWSAAESEEDTDPDPAPAEKN